jgi:anti-sigma factor RsiW
MTEEEDRMEYADQNNALRRQFDTVLTEPIPARMFMKRPAWLDYARAAVLVGAGIAIGLALPMLKPTPPNPAALVTPLPIRAARHMVYSPEVRHPVEVEAKGRSTW